MKQQEFDIYVRNTLRDAEESVSPEVWKGIAAGLDRRRKVVPFWRWTAASVAAAAAVVAGFVFLKPSAGSLEEHSQPTSIFIVESSEESPQEAPSAVAVQEEAVLPIGEQLAAGKQARTARRLPALQAPVAEVPAEEAPAAAEPVAAEPAAVQESAPAPVSEPEASHGEDAALMDRLARQEDQPFRKGFGLAVSGNLQENMRKDVGSRMPARQYGAPALQQGEGIYNATPETSFSLPLSAGVGLTCFFAPRWAVGTGLRYTYMGRTFIGDYDSGNGFVLAGTDIDNHQHWLGIPINVYFTFVEKGRWHVHTFAGGSVDFLLRNDYLVHYNKDIHYIEKSRIPQWSANLGVGVEYQLNPFLSLYLDPQFRYYFGTERQPRSLRTIQPLRFDIEAGLRFNLGR